MSVSYTVHSSFTIVSMQEEMYKDALYFFERAKTNDAAKGDTFVTWRNLRAAILFSFAAIEACINQFIDEHVNRNKGHMSQSVVDYWSERKGHVSIEDKLKQGVELYGGTRLSRARKLWTDFRELKDLRDGLVHHKVRKKLYYNTKELFKRTEKGIRTASDVIKYIYLAHPGNRAYPRVYDSVP